MLTTLTPPPYHPCPPFPHPTNLALMFVLFCDPLRLTRVILTIMGLDSDCLNIGYTAKDKALSESIKSQ